MKIVYLFAVIGFCSIFWSFAQALSAWLDDKYPGEASKPFYLNWLFYICAFLGFLGVLAHPFDNYLKTRSYKRMIHRVKATRYLAGLNAYPPDSMCDQYGFTRPSEEDQAALNEYYVSLKEVQEYCSKNNFPYISRLHDHQALDAFNYWRDREYEKLVL